MKEVSLNISDDLSFLPLDAATQTIAILARKRVGKTYTASVIAEELITAKIPIVVFDPTGAWWGLRSSADGKKEGLPVVIIGGAHADVPLEDTAGKIIADLVVDRPGYYVIDFSKFEHDTQIVKFATEFGKRFYFRKEQKRFPMQLIIDEADIVLPQHPRANEATMLHTYDNIVRRGGIRGIGMIMITQRPAVLNKNVLTQCETLIVLQISGSQDIDAIEHWTRIHGSDKERKELISSLPTLQRGEAWLWSPSWLQFFGKINIRQRLTFNSSATPKAGEKVIVPEKLAAVDIAELGDQIKATVERAKENDPDEMRKIISQLRKDLKDAEGRVETKTKEVPVFTEKDADALSQAEAACVKVGTQIGAFVEQIQKLQLRFSNLDEHLAKFNGMALQNRRALPPSIVLESKPPKTKFISAKTGVPSKANGVNLGKPERAILQVLANNPNGALKRKVAVSARYSVNGGSFKNALSSLRTAGLITYGDPIELTDAGREIAPEPCIFRGKDLYQAWSNDPLLGRPEREILRVLWEGATNEVFEIPKEDIAAECTSNSGEPYEVDGGSFKNALSKLRTLELITRGNPIRLQDVFYE